MFDLFAGKPFGIYIMDNKVRVLQLKGDKKKPRARAIGERKIPPGVVVNGELRKERELAEIITGLLAETKPKSIKQKKCYVALPDEQSYEYIFSLPAELEEEELKEKINEKVGQTIPVPFHEIKYDFKSYKLGKVQMVFVVAVPRIIIAQFYEVLKAFCGLKPQVFEPESVSLVRNLPIELNSKEGTLIIRKKSGKIQWISFWGSIIFDNNSIDIEETGNFEDILLTDIQNSIEFFKKNTKQNIGRIIIDESLAPLEEKLEARTKVRIKRLESYKVDLSNMGVKTPSGFAAVSGAALGGLDVKTTMPINLMKKEDEKK